MKQGFLSHILTIDKWTIYTSKLYDNNQGGG